MPLRFDKGEQIRNSEITPEGFLRAEAVFARDGILEYKAPDGKTRRELRLPEENKKALTSFGLTPISLEHPPVLIDSFNSKEYSKGLSDSTVIYDKGGFVKGVITVLDSEVVNSIKNREAVEVSAGYKCNLDYTPGVWNGERYDAIQRDIQVNHIAITRRGRAGPEVRVYCDNEDDKDVLVDGEYSKATSSNNPPTSTKSSKLSKKMAKITLDSVTYDDIPETFASTVGAKIKELETVSNKLDAAMKSESAKDKKIKELEAIIAELTEENEASSGRSDGLEEILNNAIPILEQHGYSWNSDAASFDASKIENEQQSYQEEDEEEEEDFHQDSAADIFHTWRRAVALGIDENRFDGNCSCHDIRATTISELDPEVDLSDKSSAWIEGYFESLEDAKLDNEDDKEYNQDSLVERNDAYADCLGDMTKLSKSYRTQPTDDLMGATLSESWQQPLALSR